MSRDRGANTCEHGISTFNACAPCSNEGPSDAQWLKDASAVLIAVQWLSRNQFSASYGPQVGKEGLLWRVMRGAFDASARTLPEAVAAVRRQMETANCGSR